MKILKGKDKQMHRLFIKIIDENVKPVTDQNGVRYVAVKWIEVSECNLGSVKNPNKDILEFRFEPIDYEGDTLRW